MKKTIVVGGGIVGITAAFFAKKKGDDVILIEASDRLGGLLKSDCSDNGCFDYGTHIASMTGIDELDEFLFSDFSKSNAYLFNLGRSGSFFNGHLSELSPYPNVNSLSSSMLNKGRVEMLSSSDSIGANLEETLINRYGEVFYLGFVKDIIVNIFGESPQLLANECLRFFDMDRLLAFDEVATERLKSIDVFDDKISFLGARKGCKKLYPKSGGIGTCITFLEKKLFDIGVSIKKNTVLSNMKYKSPNYYLESSDEEFEADELIWTLSSALLNKFIPTNVVSSKPSFRKTGLYYFIFKKPLKTECYYINVHDVDLLANRITCYQNLEEIPSFFAITVEVLEDFDFDFNLNIKLVLNQLYKSGIIENNNECLFSQCRELKEGFPTLTVEMTESLEKINAYYEKNHSNVTLLGRSSAKGFFASELIVNAYREVYE